MKKLFANKTFRLCLGLFVTALFFIAGHNETAGGSMLATAAAAGVDDPELSETEKMAVAAVKKEIDQAVLDARKGLMTSEEFTTKLEDFQKGLKEKEFKELNEILLKQGIDINKIKEGATGGSEANTSLKAEIKKQLLAKADEIKRIAKEGTGSVNINVVNKVAELVDTGNFGTGVIRGLRETEIDRRQMRQRNVMNVITIINGGPDSDPISWIERRPKEGGAAFITEGTTKPYVDHTWTEGKAAAEFIAVATPVSRKALTVMSILESEIDDILTEELMDALEEYILRNAASSALVNSVWSYAKAFTGASLALAVEGANEFDVLRAAILQARKGNPSDVKHSGRMPNRIYISLDIQAKMDLIKDGEGRYLLPPFMSADGVRIAGVEVVGTEFLGDDEFLVGDFTRYAFNIVSPMDIQIGYINEQFIDNEMTIRCELMGNGRIKYHDTWSFVRGAFITAKAALETA
jgi:hypothetical protein